MKNFTIITAAITFIVTCITPSTMYAQENVFTDVELGNRFFVPLQYLKDNGLVEGYKDGSFQPDQLINRAEALTLLLQSIKKKPPAATLANAEIFNFPDVTIENWFYNAIMEAWKANLIKGYPNGRFHPEKPINVVESLKIALLREGQSIPSQVTEKPYTDISIDAWYAPFAVVSKNRTLFLESRTNGSLGPTGSLSRGEFAQLVYRVIKSNYGSRFARATWYADFMAKQSTASGEPYVPNRFTTAHKTLPFGTKLRVTNLSNGKSVDVTVNDRGPYAQGVDLDLSRSAFEALASPGAGIITVEYEEISEEPAHYGF